MDLFNKDSKIWDLLNILAIGFVLWINAQNFDETEIKTIIEFAAVYYGINRLKKE